MRDVGPSRVGHRNRFQTTFTKKIDGAFALGRLFTDVYSEGERAR
jgi:hypothetical protein